LILIEKFAFFFKLLLLRNAIESGYIVEPIRIGIELLSFLDQILDNYNIANHEYHVLLAHNLQLITDGIGIDSKCGV
jgi:hypothetical protein